MVNNDEFARTSLEHRAPGFPTDENNISVTPFQNKPDGPNPSEAPAESSALFERVLQSDIGITTLLTRLKQSITSIRVKEFAAFLKKRSALEEEHAQGFKKLCKTSYETTRRAEGRKESFAQNLDELTRVHDRMADNGIQFAMSLHQMHEDLQELAADKERGRKQWKQSGLAAEKRVQDAESAMEKARLKYNSLAEDYDRARTGDKQSGRFGLKGVKSAAQVEEDLQRKVQAADADYSSKVQISQATRHEYVTTARPQTIHALQQLISECDSALTLQMQKYASFNEKILLSNGLCISPLRSQTGVPGTQGRGLREIVSSVDNEQDLRVYVTSFASRVENKQEEIKYERHPTLQTLQQPLAQAPNRAPQHSNIQQPTLSLQETSSISAQQVESQGFKQTQSPSATYSITGKAPQIGHPELHNHSPVSPSGAPQVSTTLSNPVRYSQLSSPAPGPPSQTLAQDVPHQKSNPPTDLPPLRPVFGLSLEELLNRDGSAVPMVVYQCLQAVDLFGLEVEGIYRLSGTASHISKLRSMFDNDASRVDFRNPENFFHDVNSVAGLLKQFFRDLPDPLLPRVHYDSFIEAARINDNITRRDVLHATINSLPDANYATLRALVLHLYRVQEHSSVNRMNGGNLAICFGPTLMGANSGPKIADAGWQVRVIDTILQNTYQIFDDD